jgi:hypothetical protein
MSLVDKLDLRSIKIGTDILSGCAFFVASLWYGEFIYFNIGKSKIKNAVDNYKDYKKEKTDYH